MVKKHKNTLSYSEMTDNVYWHNGRGEKTKVNDSFMTVLLLMAKRWAGETSKGFRQLFKATDDEHEDLYLDVKLLTKEDIEKEKENEE